ncbi:MAG: M15 family metallopeptidase [Cyanobacteria bacterium J06649_11]
MDNLFFINTLSNEDAVYYVDRYGFIIRLVDQEEEYSGYFIDDDNVLQHVNIVPFRTIEDFRHDRSKKYELTLSNSKGKDKIVDTNSKKHSSIRRVLNYILIFISVVFFTTVGLVHYLGDTPLKRNNEVPSTDTISQTEEGQLSTSEKKVEQLQTILSKDKVMGKVLFSKDESYVAVAAKHCSKSMYLEKNTYAAFMDMFEAAKREGVDLKIVSGARNFRHQKSIWERKWDALPDVHPIDRALSILEYSSMPGSSRHHWGTEVDLNSLENSYFESGRGELVYQWLIKNANRFGFYQVYSNKSIYGRSGYNEEKWHWSYLPVANRYLEYYNREVDYSDFIDFYGADIADDVRIIEDYVNGVTLPN